MALIEKARANEDLTYFESWIGVCKAMISAFCPKYWFVNSAVDDRWEAIIWKSSR